MSEPTQPPVPDAEAVAEVSAAFKQLEAVGRWVSDVPPDDALLNAAVVALSFAGQETGKPVTRQQLKAVQQWVSDFIESLHTFGMLVGGMLDVEVVGETETEMQAQFSISAYGQQILQQVGQAHADTPAKPE